jgi:hypothetical protein
MTEHRAPFACPPSPLLVLSDDQSGPRYRVLRAGQTALIERPCVFVHAGKNGESRVTLERVAALGVANAGDVASHAICIDGGTITHTVRFRGHGRFMASFDALGDLLKLEGECIALVARGTHVVIGRLGAAGLPTDDS